MSSRDGIQELKREIDSFKFKVDDLCENEIAHLSVTSPDRYSAYKRAHALEKDLDGLRKRIDSLSTVDQKMSATRLNDKKATEQQRIVDLQRRLNELTTHLEPDEVEEDYFRVAENSLSVSPDDSLESEHNTVQPTHNAYTPPSLHQVKSILKSPDKYDNQPKNDSKSVTIRNDLDDDDEDDDDTDDDDDDDYDSELDNMEDNNRDGKLLNEVSQPEQSDIIYTVEALSDFQGEQPDDLSFKEGDIINILLENDDGWWWGQKKDGHEGLVPSTLVKILDPNAIPKNKKDVPPMVKRRSGKELWGVLKDTKGKTTVTDVLQAMKAVPSGFRNPMLGKWFHKNEEYRASWWVTPKTSTSNLQLRDLFWDNINKKLKTHPVKLCRTFSLQSVRCIPTPGAGVDVLSRYVYVALWDQEKVLSNIHVIKGVLIEKDMSWSFTPKIGKNIPSLFDGDFLVRINDDRRKISLLFELNYAYIRTEKRNVDVKNQSTGEKGNLSCGWGSLPLFDENGAPVGNKSFDVHIHGGTPFQKGVPLDASSVFNPNHSLMQSLIRSNRQPRLVVKATGYNKLTKETYDMLPQTIVTTQKYARVIGIYRHHAATLLARHDVVPSEPLCDSIMSYFPRALNYPDLMDALLQVWDEKNRIRLNRSQRKNMTSLYTLFKECFMESVFALMQCAELPPYVWSDETTNKLRNVFISTYLQRRLPLGGLLSGDYVHRPLNINKVTYSLTNQCAIPPPITKDVLTENTNQS